MPHLIASPQTRRLPEGDLYDVWMTSIVNISIAGFRRGVSHFFGHGRSNFEQTRRPSSVPFTRFPMSGSKFGKLPNLNGDVPLGFLIYVNAGFVSCSFLFPKGISQ